jgi:hypothetical protein
MFGMSLTIFEKIKVVGGGKVLASPEVYNPIGVIS